MTSAITPENLLKLASTKPEVIETINEIMVENWDGCKTSFTIQEFRKVLKKEYPDIVFNKKLLFEIKQLYSNKGWKVDIKNPDDYYNQYAEDNTSYIFTIDSDNKDSTFF